MKKSRIKTAFLITLVGIVVSIVSYYSVAFTRPYRYGMDISNLKIPYNSTLVGFKHSVGDFDGSSSTRIYFSISPDNLKDMEQQCLKLKYRQKPIVGFSLGSDSALFINGANNYYYHYKNYSPQPRGYNFVLFNKEKKMLYILSEKTF